MADREAVARMAGAEWSDIDEYLGDATRTAFAAGGTQDDIDEHLGFNPGAVDQRAVDLASAPGFDYNPMNPMLRASYADALHEGSVRGAFSLADTLVGVGLTDTGPAGRESALASANEIGSSLPSRRDLIDASLALGGDPENYEVTRGNLIDHWWETGQAPLDAADEAGRNGELKDRLTQPRGLLGEFWNAGVRGAGSIFFGINQLANTALAQAMPETAAADAKVLRRVMDDFNRDYAPTRKDIGGWAANLVGEGAVMAASLVAAGPMAAISYGALHGADQAWRDTHDLSAAAAGAAIGGTEMGLPFAVLHGVVGKKLVAAAVSSAIRMGGVGGLSAVLDPIPDYVGGKGYRLTPEDIGQGVASGAVLGLLGGTLAKAMEPRIRVLKADGTSETMRYSERPQADEALHAAAQEDALKTIPTDAERETQIAEAKATVAEGGDAEAATARVEQQQQLTDSYRAGSFFKNLFGRLIGDESGKVELPTGDDTFDRVEKLVREPYFDKYVQKLGVSEILNPLRRIIDPYRVKYAEALRSNDPDKIVNSDLGLLQRYMDGEPGIDLHADHPLKPVADVFRRLNGLSRARMEDAAARGNSDPIKFMEDYWRHYWTKPDEAMRLGSFMKQRTIPYWSEGIQKGLRPAIEDVIDHVHKDLTSRADFLASREIERRVVEHGFGEWHTDVPQDATLRAVQGATRRVPADGAVAARREAEARASTEPHLPGLEISDAVRWDVNKDEAMVVQQLYATETVARMLESLRGNDRLFDSTWIKRLNYISNTLQSVKMALPIFHAFVEAKAGMATGIGVFLRSAMAGDPQGMRAIRNAVVGQIAEGRTQTAGLAKLGLMEPAEYEAMIRENPLLSMIRSAGFRPGSRQSIYMPGRATNLFERGFRGYTQELNAEFGGSMADKLGAIPYEMGRLATTATAPLFDYGIPYLKAGAVWEQARTFLRQNPDASPEEVYRMGRQIVDNTDDRMGELNLDFVFWKPFYKRLFALTAISTGWVYGTWRASFAAMGYRFRQAGAGGSWEINSPAMFNLAGALATVVGSNMIYQYIKTGALPGGTEDMGRLGGPTPWLDLVAPRTGGTTKGGAPARALLPGEEKEYYDWGKIGAETIAQLNAPHGGFGPFAITFTRDVAKYFAAKDRTWLRIATSLATGEDAVGHEIAYTPQGLGRYFLSEVSPIQVTSIENRRPKAAMAGETALGQLPPYLREAESLAGFREQPDWVADPRRFTMIQNNLANRRWRDELRRYRREQAYLR